MILEQHYLGCLSHASYMIGDEKTKTAVIVDPQRDTDRYVEEAERLDLVIRHVFLTHCHADFVAGHIELKERAGAEIHLGPKAGAEFDFTPAPEGIALEFGDVRLGILETPGHTPESICILVYDLRKSDKDPHAVLTGDTLFIGDVGRPDLLASIGASAEDLGGLLYDSLHEKLLSLPDETLVYPAHGAGSMCGKNLSTDTVSTIGDQRRLNYALQPMEKEEFVKLVSGGQPDAPQYFLFDAGLNRKKRPSLEKSLRESLRPMSIDDTLRGVNAGAVLLDARDGKEFAAGHVVDAVNIALDGRFATWAGTLFDPEKTFVIIARPGEEREAAVRLGRIGYDRVLGYLEGGMEAVADRPDLLRRTGELTPGELADQLRSAAPPVLLDVRTTREWEEKRIQDSLNIPLNGLMDRAGELPRDRKVAIYCETGYRSSVAASLLERHGVKDTTHLVGGIDAWEKAKMATVASAVQPT